MDKNPTFLLFAGFLIVFLVYTSSISKEKPEIETKQEIKYPTDKKTITKLRPALILIGKFK